MNKIKVLKLFKTQRTQLKKKKPQNFIIEKIEAIHLYRKTQTNSLKRNKIFVIHLQSKKEISKLI